MQRFVKPNYHFIVVSFVTLISQGFFIRDRGVHAETYWITRNQDYGLISGFLYSDSSRLFMSLPFHLTYLFFRESFLAIQVAYLIYGIAIALLTVLVSTKVLNSKFLASISGLVAGTHAGDLSNGLFSMIVVKQVVLITLVLVNIVFSENQKRHLEKQNKGKESSRFVPIFTIFLLSFVALFTYESVTIPILVLLTFAKIIRSRSFLPLLASISIWGLFSVYRYMVLNNVSYQSSKFRLPSITDLSTGISNYISAGINPLSWDKPYVTGFFRNCIESMQSIVGSVWITISVLTLIFVMIGAFVSTKRETDDIRQEKSNIYFVLAMLFAGYIPYLFVSDGTGNWRTQFLSVPWIGIGLAFILANIFTKRRLVVSTICATSLAGVFVVFGIRASLMQQLEYSARWDNHLKFFGSLVSQTPGLPQDTQVLVINVPEKGADGGLCLKDETDPFEDPYWLQASLSAYFAKRVTSSTYIKRNEFSINEDMYMPGSKQLRINDTLLSLENLLIVEFTSSGQARVIDKNVYLKERGIEINYDIPEVTRQNKVSRVARLNLIPHSIRRP